MSIKELVNAALKSIAPTHATNLPDNPAFPCFVFDIETTQEETWVQGGGYEQHEIKIVILARTLGELETLKKQARTAMEGVAGYMWAEDSGDAAFEPDPKVYGFYQNHRVRTQLH